MAKKEKNTAPKSFLNKKAYHDYTIEDSFEAGIVLEGSEIKAIRAGRVNIKDSFIRIIKDEVFLLQAHISHLETAHSTYRPNESRDRKLLLHRKQIAKLHEKVAKDGYTIVPLKLYFNKYNMLKIQIGLAKGKKEYDKREALKQKTHERETQRILKNWNR